MARRVRVTHHIAWINDDLHRGTVEDLFDRDSPRLFIIILAPLPIIASRFFDAPANILCYAENNRRIDDDAFTVFSNLSFLPEAKDRGTRRHEKFRSRLDNARLSCIYGKPQD